MDQDPNHDQVGADEAFDDGFLWLSLQSGRWWRFMAQDLMIMMMTNILIRMINSHDSHLSTRPTKLGKKKDDMSFDDVSLFSTMTHNDPHAL